MYALRRLRARWSRLNRVGVRAELEAVQAELAGVKQAFAATVESLESQRGAARSALAVCSPCFARLL